MIPQFLFTPLKEMAQTCEESKKVVSEVHYIVYGYSSLLLVVSLSVLFLMFRRRNMQPLKKRSPLLLMTSVIGNQLCQFNALAILYCFQEFRFQQSKCFETYSMASPRDYNTFDSCMKAWTNENKSTAIFADLNGLMIINFSEFLALGPYLLRALRIQKMFEAREIYYNYGAIPKSMIQRWDECRILKIATPILVLVSSCFIAFGMVEEADIYVPNYNSLSYPMVNNGSFDQIRMGNGQTIMNAFISGASFIQYLLLGAALNAQWHIEPEYSIFWETFSVSMIWLLLNTMFTFSWIFETNVFGPDPMTLNELNWFLFTIISVRSLFLILVSSIYTLYQSYKSDQDVLIPPDVRTIVELEQVLHNIIAIDYFYEYLEREESTLENSFGISTSGNEKYNKSLLGLYADIRFYDSEIQRAIQAENTLRLMTSTMHYVSSQQSGRSSEISSGTSDNKVIENNSESAASTQTEEREKKSSRMREVERISNLLKMNAMEIAHKIFEDYIAEGARFEVRLDKEVLEAIYARFGLKYESGSSQMLVSFVQEVDQEVLKKNLNPSLFVEVYNNVLDQLQVCFDCFKESKGYQILKEDIIRQEILYEVMVEGKFIKLE